MAALRILDAAANRAREGMRVVEDYVRFGMDDGHFTQQLKQLRHDLAAALECLPMPARLAARETHHDVGTDLTTAAEGYRASSTDVVTANFLRCEEALRSIEEYGKIAYPKMAAAVEQIRYRTYTLQRALDATQTGQQRLADARLYVLVNGRPSPEEFADLVRTLIVAGAHVLQLRDKTLADRELLARARLLRELTRNTPTLFIMNDRPDLAVLAQADGVHVGQEELSVKDARTIVGPTALVGVSTHSLEQARRAVMDGANYIGVGPTFPSTTKDFAEFPGLDLVRGVTAEIRLPAFAIGGISQENVAQVLAAGATRIAVSGAVTSVADPATAVRNLQSALSTEQEP